MRKNNPKKILVTAGNTQVPIDQVRAITNIFTGKTGTAIAHYFAKQGCEVTLITSSPGLATEAPANLRVVKYKTFDDLEIAMQAELGKPDSGYDAVIHSAAVSDYQTAGIFVEEAEKKMLEIAPSLFYELSHEKLVEISKTGKVSSQNDCLYLKLVKTKKLVDLIRRSWGFKGVLVKFKLEVGKNMGELLAIAVDSMKTSDADFLVANCLEWSQTDAYIMGSDGKGLFCKRPDLARELYERIIAYGKNTLGNNG